MENESWILPDGIDEVLPPQAGLIDLKRRELLDLYKAWGYEFVIPPFVEFIESLLTGTGSDLDLQTFKLTDQLSGRMLGIRADITPQTARIDAHHIGTEAPVRLCYLGTVLHTRSDGFAGTRSPLQIGAELYGHAGVESDIEILRLMMQTLEKSGIRDVYLDLGHVGIFKGLATQAGLDAEQEMSLFDALQRKAMPEVAELLDSYRIESEHAEMLLKLGELNGEGALAHAEEVLRAAAEPVQGALRYLHRMAEQISIWLPGVPVHFDLAELRGYHFHTGVVFAAFVPSSGKEIARGGRYDGIGKTFGRSRPATGFSTDLKTLMLLGQSQAVAEKAAVYAPWGEDQALRQRIDELRQAGRCVICGLPGQQGGPREMGCTEQLSFNGTDWELIPI